MDTTINVKEFSEITEPKSRLFEMRDIMVEDERLRHQKEMLSIQNWFWFEMGKLDSNKSGGKCECSCGED